MTSPTDQRTTDTRTAEELLQDLAARVAVPHFEDVLERHAGL